MKVWLVLILCYIVYILLMSGLLYFKHYQVALASLCILPLLIYYAMRKLKQLKIFKAGMEGEKKTLELLKHLPKNYYIICNKRFNKDQETEVDFLVVSPSGVKIIEVKNYAGTLIGKTNDQRWIQKKVLRDKTVEKHVKNPIKQLNRQLRILESVLYELEIQVKLEGKVYIAHPYFKATYTYEEIIHGEQSLLKWIQEGETLLSKKEVKKIYKTLK